MNDIKFRGKRIDTGEWVYGWLLTNKLGTYIITEKNPRECTQYGYLEINEYYRVISETVGQFIELKDKNNQEIYENDIVIQKDAYHTVYGIVKFGKIPNDSRNTGGHQGFYIDWQNNGENKWRDWWRCDFNYWKDEAEIIGNIYENPELLEVSNEIQ